MVRGRADDGDSNGEGSGGQTVDEAVGKHMVEGRHCGGSGAGSERGRKLAP